MASERLPVTLYSLTPIGFEIAFREETMEFVQQPVAQIHDWDRSRQISPYTLDCGQNIPCSPENLFVYR